MLARRRGENTVFVPFSTERHWRGVIIPLHTTPAPKTASGFPRLGRTCGLIAVEPEQGRRDEEMSANRVCLTQAENSGKILGSMGILPCPQEFQCSPVPQAEFHGSVQSCSLSTPTHKPGSDTATSVLTNTLGP